MSASTKSGLKVFQKIECLFTVAYRLYLEILFSEDRVSNYLLYGNLSSCEQQLVAILYLFKVFEEFYLLSAEKVKTFYPSALPD